MCIKQEDLSGKDLFILKDNELVCSIEGCGWSIDCDSEEPFKSFIDHIKIEHIGISRKIKKARNNKSNQ